MGKQFLPLPIQNGVVLFDGKPGVFITADYPYYRDDPHNWEDRLASLKRLSIQAVTAYIPWRHHQPAPDALPDFTGKTQANRDVIGFFHLCSALDLPVIAKPGPFIHGEVNYGGLPDWVCPTFNPAIEALLNSRGEPELWSGSQLKEDGMAIENWPLPAPFSVEFQRFVHIWMQQVAEEVIHPLQAPHGPIIALQIANEGIYSNGQHAPWAYDYSPSALSLFHKFLAEKYQNIALLNQLYQSHFPDWDAVPAPRRWEPLQPAQSYIDWGEFSAFYMDKVFCTWAEPLASPLPILINQNPPLKEPYGLDAWLSRVEPERWGSVHYGFTNWVGDISADASAFTRYVLTAKRAPGLNMEENWGFARLYAPSYADASTSFYQTLVILNSGATGFNIYTGASTHFADPNLEVLPQLPYPDAAPITAQGKWTPKAEIVRWLDEFFHLYGAEFLECRSWQPAAWAYSLSAARIGAWQPESNDGETQHGKYLGEFQRQMRALHLDYGLINLENAAASDLLAYPYLYTAAGERMPAAAQRALAEYARQGGKLTLLGTLPSFDELGQPCTELHEAKSFLRNELDVDAESALAALQRVSVLEGEADVWLRSHPHCDLHYLTILLPANANGHVVLSFMLNEIPHQLKLSAAPSAGAILRLENGQITAALIKGNNTYLGYALGPMCQLDDQLIGTNELGDFAQWEGFNASIPAGKTLAKEVL